MTELDLSSPVRMLAGIGSVTAEQLRTKGIVSVGDLLSFFPQSYRDYSQPDVLGRAQPGKEGLFRVRVRGKADLYTGRNGTRILSFRATDDDRSCSARIVVYGKPYLQSRIRDGGELYVFGAPARSESGLSFSGAQLFFSRPAFSFQPIYALPANLKQGPIHKAILDAVRRTNLPDPHTEAYLKKYGLPDLRTAYSQIHSPANMDEAERARRRFLLDDSFVLARLLASISDASRGPNDVPIHAEAHLAQFRSLLPFELTAGQTAAMLDIARDLSGPFRMNRLVQGDVGSGKTMVALFAAYAAVKDGYDAYLLAPTEVLAKQHARTAELLLPGRVALVTGRMSAKARRETAARVREQEGTLIVGTHALLYESVPSANAALLITDEQHRFGVYQRRQLLGEGASLHSLTMTATPIPRSLALALHGQTNVSTISDLPPGRHPIKTSYVPAERLPDMFRFIAERARAGRQAYIVCPAIEESETFPVHSAVSLYEWLKKKYPDVSFGLVHGSCSPEEKENVMNRFSGGSTRVLVATTVIEVGIDVPSASVVAVLDADRFGLAQLHQLRGRVGRGSEPSYCFPTTNAAAALPRLKLLCRTTNGFEVAEQDLKARGAGDFLGERQHGVHSALAMFTEDNAAWMQRIRHDLRILGSEPCFEQDFRYFTDLANAELDKKLDRVAFN